MDADQTQPSGPDFTTRIDAALLADGAMLLSHIGQDPVVLARSGGEVCAVGATCTHYAALSRKDCWSATRCAVHGIMPASEPFDAVPFFWSAHYDTQVLYVGHAETSDTLQIDGPVEARDCRVAFRSAGRTLTVATIDRDSIPVCRAGTEGCRAGSMMRRSNCD